MQMRVFVVFLFWCKGGSDVPVLWKGSRSAAVRTTSTLCPQWFIVIFIIITLTCACLL